MSDETRGSDAAAPGGGDARDDYKSAMDSGDGAARARKRRREAVDASGAMDETMGGDDEDGGGDEDGDGGEERGDNAAMAGGGEAGDDGGDGGDGGAAAATPKKKKKRSPARSKRGNGSGNQRDVRHRVATDDSGA